MNETMMTLRGNVVDRPKLRLTKSGHAVANFRVASTQRRFDREQNGWVDAGTLFVAVSAWRALGENAARSLDRGQPVVVYGRYCQRDYVKDDGPKIAYELEAVAVGHDLSRGVSDFTRVQRSTVVDFDVDETGAPADVSEEVHGITDPDSPEVDIEQGDHGPLFVDGITGEVREPAPV